MVFENKKKTKLIIQISAPRSGSRWLRDTMLQHPQIIQYGIDGIGGIEKLENYDFGKIISYIGKVECMYIWMPHGMMAMKSIINLSKNPLVNLKIIHLIRDGRNVAASYLALRVKDATTAGNNWKKFVECGIEYRYLPNYHEVKYEDLRNNHENTLRKILEFCEIPFHKNILKIRIGEEKSKFEQLDNKQQQDIMEVIKKLLKELNYEN